VAAQRCPVVFPDFPQKTRFFKAAEKPPLLSYPLPEEQFMDC
jgi:hypothetical protein